MPTASALRAPEPRTSAENLRETLACKEICDALHTKYDARRLNIPRELHDEWRSLLDAVTYFVQNLVFDRNISSNDVTSSRMFHAMQMVLVECEYFATYENTTQFKHSVIKATTIFFREFSWCNWSEETIMSLVADDLRKFLRMTDFYDNLAKDQDGRVIDAVGLEHWVKYVTCVYDDATFASIVA